MLWLLARSCKLLARDTDRAPAVWMRRGSHETLATIVGKGFAKRDRLIRSQRQALLTRAEPGNEPATFQETGIQLS